MLAPSASSITLIVVLKRSLKNNTFSFYHSDNLYLKFISGLRKGKKYYFYIKKGCIIHIIYLHKPISSDNQCDIFSRYSYRA